MQWFTKSVISRYIQPLSCASLRMATRTTETCNMHIMFIIQDTCIHLCACVGFVVCTGFWWGNLRERDHWGDPDVDGRIILRWIFRKWEGVVGTGWSWFRIGTSGGHL
jgi:hypothetical protein